MIVIFMLCGLIHSINPSFIEIEHSDLIHHQIRSIAVYHEIEVKEDCSEGHEVVAP